MGNERVPAHTGWGADRERRCCAESSKHGASASSQRMHPRERMQHRHCASNPSQPHAPSRESYRARFEFTAAEHATNGMPMAASDHSPMTFPAPRPPRRRSCQTGVIRAGTIRRKSARIPTRRAILSFLRAFGLNGQRNCRRRYQTIQARAVKREHGVLPQQAPLKSAGEKPSRHDNSPPQTMRPSSNNGPLDHGLIAQFCNLLKKPPPDDLIEAPPALDEATAGFVNRHNCVSGREKSV